MAIERIVLERREVIQFHRPLGYNVGNHFSLG
jgi:hypothetical protein